MDAALVAEALEGLEVVEVGERFRAPHCTLIASNLTDAERQVLLETFGARQESAPSNVPLTQPSSPWRLILRGRGGCH